MRLELNSLLEIRTEDEFDYYDSYYSAVSDYFFMDVINTLIEDIAYPVFIVKNSDRTVYAFNEAARNGIDSRNITGEYVDSILDVNDFEINNQSVVFFNNEWRLLRQDIFRFNDESFLKIELTDRTGVPDSITLDRWKNMIALMLHRFRSPLTGIGGYVDLLNDDSDSEVHPYVAKIDAGINQLNDIMDELEYLYHIPSKFDVAKLTDVDIAATVNRVLLKCSEQNHKRVRFLASQNSSTVKATAESLEKVLEQLVNNALLHSPSNSSPVTIAVHSEKCIQISNEHPGISEDLLPNLFFPFVTSRANNLGIGLTLALIYANQFGGTIFLTQNGEKNRVSFIICFP